MLHAIRVPLSIIVGIAIFLALIYFGPNIKQHFGERYNTVDRKVFVKGQSYIGGAEQDLAKQKLAYELSSDDHTHAAIKAYVVMNYADLDLNDINPLLAAWVRSLSNPSF